MKRITAVAVVVVTLALAGYSQATPGQGIASRVQIDDGGTIRLGPPFHATLKWRVRAPKHLCIARRRVVLYFNRENRRHRVDSDWTNGKGAAVLSGSWHNTPHRMIVKLRKKRIVKPGHDYTCSHDRYRHTFRR